MLSTTQNRIGYGALTVGVVLGLFFSYRNDGAIEKVNDRQNELISIQRDFILDQCDRDKTRDQVIIRSLQDAKYRALISLKNDLPLQSIISQRLDDQIHDIKNAKPCKLPKGP